MLGLAIFYVPDGAITPAYAIYRIADGTYFDFASSGATAQTFCASPTTVAGALARSAIGAGGGLAKYTPAAPLAISGALAAQFADGGYIYELFDSSQSPPVLSLLEDPISVWISAGTDQLAPNTATVTGPVTVGAFGAGVTVPLPATPPDGYGGGDGQSGDVYALVAPLIASGAFKGSALVNAPTGGGTGQTGDTYALLSPLIASAAFRASALVNAPTASLDARSKAYMQGNVVKDPATGATAFLADDGETTVMTFTPTPGNTGGRTVS